VPGRGCDAQKGFDAEKCDLGNCAFPRPFPRPPVVYAVAWTKWYRMQVSFVCIAVVHSPRTAWAAYDTVKSPTSILRQDVRRAAPTANREPTAT